MTQVIAVGVLVEHILWGLGKVLAVSPPYVTIYFKTLEHSTDGPLRKLQTSAPQLTISATQSDPELDAIGRDIKHPRSRQTRRPPIRPMSHSLDQAIEWFRRDFPQLFADPELIRRELLYKREAHEKFMQLLGNGQAERLLQSNAGDAIADALSGIYHSTNIPSRFELMAVNDGLKDRKAATRLLSGLLAFVRSPDDTAFSELVGAVGSLPARQDGSRVLTWPNVTILPFLADPGRFMVLKPQIARRTARRLHFDMLYSSSVTWPTYKAFMDMCAALRDRLAPLGAKDYIDVQSFMWVTTDLD